MGPEPIQFLLEFLTLLIQIRLKQQGFTFNMTFIHFDTENLTLPLAVLKQLSLENYEYEYLANLISTYTKVKRRLKSKIYSYPF